MDKIDVFFEEASQLIKDYRNERQSAALDFNLFSVTCIKHKEVPICSFLAELLSPSGRHCRGTFFLRSFLTDVINLENINDYDISQAKVTTEKSIKDKRRIDILIDLKELFIPIEVKIYADDQEEQLVDYLSFARKSNPNAKIYYLTLDGHEPTTKSKGKLKEKEDYERISFENNIYDWIDKAHNQLEVQSIQRLYDAISQFLDVIRMLTNRGDGTMNEKVNSLITSSDDFETAKVISDSLVDLEIDKLTDIYKKIEQSINGKFGNERLITDYKDRIYNYYKKGTNTWPSINYILPPRKDAPEGEFVLRVENEWHLYFGVCNWDNEQKYNPHTVKTDHLAKEKQEYILKSCGKDKDEDKMTDVFYWWDYLSSNNNTNYNFRNINEGYEKLFDNDTYETYINDICKKIVDFIDDWYKEI